MNQTLLQNRSQLFQKNLVQFGILKQLTDSEWELKLKYIRYRQILIFDAKKCQNAARQTMKKYIG